MHHISITGLVGTPFRLFFLAALFSLSCCSQNFTVSVNNQAVFDPTGRLYAGDLADPDLQGCLNIAMQQQGIENAGLLQVLSCANSRVETLANIEQLAELRFLDVNNNRIRDISPLRGLQNLSGLNLANNGFNDISPLLSMTTLTSVNLLGNNELPCLQLQTLEDRLGSNLSRPASCQN